MRKDKRLGSNFWPVYADLTMVVLFIFILFLLIQFVINLYLQMMKELDERTEAMLKVTKKMEGVQREIYDRLIKNPRITPKLPDGDKQRFIFGADVLFKPDYADLTPEGRALLSEFVNLILNYDKFYDRIEIEGHADSNRSTRFHRPGDVPQDHGNWRLSAERAISVGQLIQALGLEALRDNSNERSREFRELSRQIAVIGRSYYDPVGSADQNRRIEICLYYSRKKIAIHEKVDHLLYPADGGSQPAEPTEPLDPSRPIPAGEGG